MNRSEREKSGVTGTGMEEDIIFDEYRRAAERIHVDDDMRQRVLRQIELRFSDREIVADEASHPQSGTRHRAAAMAACAAIFIIIVSGTRLLHWHKTYEDEIKLTGVKSAMTSSDIGVKYDNPSVDSYHESSTDENDTPDNTDIDYTKGSEYSGSGIKETPEDINADEPSLEPLTHAASIPESRDESENHQGSGHVHYSSDTLDTENPEYAPSGINETEKGDILTEESSAIDLTSVENLPDLTIPEAETIGDNNKENTNLDPIHQIDESADDTLPVENTPAETHGDSVLPGSPDDTPKPPWECLGPNAEPDVSYYKDFSQDSMETVSSKVHYPVYSIGWLPFETDKVVYRSVVYWSEIFYLGRGQTVILAQTVNQPPEDVLSSYNYGAVKINDCIVWLHHDDYGLTRACWIKDEYWFFLYATKAQTLEEMQNMIVSVAGK